VKRAEKAEASVAAGETPSVKKSAPKKAKKEEVAAPASSMEKTTLGDIQSLVDLKDQMVEAAAKSAAKAAKKAKAEAAPVEKKAEKVAEEKPVAEKVDTKKVFEEKPVTEKVKATAKPVVEDTKEVEPEA